MTRLLVFMLCFVVSCAPPPPAAAPPPPPAPPAPAPVPRPDATMKETAVDWTVDDTLASFWAFWGRAEGKPTAEQAALFRELVVEPRPELFTAQVVGRDPTKPHDLDAQIDAFVATVPELVAPMRKLSASIEDELPAHRATFLEAFPDFAWDGQVIFTVSLDAFDGAVRMVEGEPVLMFGIDKVARLHGMEASLAPLFHHELFHVHHLVTGSPFEGENLMYQALWAEGLAVYVAHELNPEATWSQLVLSDAMVAQGERQLASLAKEFLDHVDSSDETFYRDWFRGAGQREDIPNRVGYFLGYRVAKKLGESRSLQELAAMKDPALRAAIVEALTELAG